MSDAGQTTRARPGRVKPPPGLPMGRRLLFAGGFSEAVAVVVPAE